MSRRDFVIPLLTSLLAALSSGLFGSHASQVKFLDNRLAKDRGCGVIPVNPHYVSVEPADTPKTFEGVIRRSHCTFEDFPLDHDTHDWNFFVKLDPAFFPLNSDANFIHAGERLMEMEWETKYLPLDFWPSNGDRVWLRGRYIWDCGHAPYRNEIHPPHAVAFTRPEAAILTGTSFPARVSGTYMYINGRGGLHDQDPAGRIFTVMADLPPKPAGAVSHIVQVTKTLFGTKSPSVTMMPGDKRYRITYDLRQEPKGAFRRYGAVVHAGWIPDPPTESFRLLNVTLRNVRINDDHDPVQAGEWNLKISVNGKWFEVRGPDGKTPVSVDTGGTIQINRTIPALIPANGTIRIYTAGWEDDCDHTFGNRPGRFIGEAAPCGVDNNDLIGIVDHTFTAAQNHGIGVLHNLTSKKNSWFVDYKDVTAGDFTLRVSVAEVKKFTTGTTPGGTPPVNPPAFKAFGATIASGTWPEITAPRKIVYLGGDRLLDWNQDTRRWRVWRYDSSVQNQNPLVQKISEGTWSTIKLGHELINLEQDQVLDMDLKTDPAPGLESLSPYRVFPYARNSTGDPLPGPATASGSWASIKKGHQLVYIGRERIIHYNPTERRFRVYRVERLARTGTDPLPWPPVTEGVWTDPLKGNTMRYLGNDLLMDWNDLLGAYRIYKINRNAAGNQDPLITPPLAQGNSHLDLGINAADLGYDIIPLEPGKLLIWHFGTGAYKVVRVNSP